MPMSGTIQCIHLRRQFGRQYRIVKDESYRHEYGPAARVDDPWLLLIPGTWGHVFPWGGALLAATTNSSGKVTNRLKALPFVQVQQDADDGATVLFAPEKLDVIADLLKLHRRRHVSQRERQRLATLGRQFGFQPRSHGYQSDSGTRPCVGASVSDPNIVGSLRSGEDA